MNRIEHPHCSICGRIAGLTIADPEETAQIKFNPFDSKFDPGVIMFCPECQEYFNSTSAVEYYRAIRKFRENVERLAQLFGVYPLSGEMAKEPEGSLLIPEVLRRKKQL